MNYRIEDIRSEGTVLQGQLERGWLESTLQDADGPDIVGASAITYRITLSRSGTTLLIRGAIKATLEMECSRCLERFAAPVDSEFNFSLCPSAEQRHSQERELLAEDLDTEFYEGELIDVAEIIKNQVLLNVPIKPLCREDCEGLCPHCGANKNEKPCDCAAKEPGDPRLAALKKLLK